MEVKTVKLKTCMRGLKKRIDAHPRKNFGGFFTLNGRDMTDEEVRRVVSYAVKKGYDTEEDIPSEELVLLLKNDAL